MKPLILILIFILNSASAQNTPNSTVLSGDKVLPSVSNETSKKIPGDDVLPNLDIQSVSNVATHAFEKAEKSSVQTIKENQEKYIKKNASKIPKSHDKKIIVVADNGEAKAVTYEIAKLDENKELVSPQPPEADEIKLIQSSVKIENKPNYEDRSDGIRIFPRNVTKFLDSKNETITLPSGSTVKATLLGGVEVTNEERSIDVRLDSVFLGPNKSVVEMKDCIVWIRLKANFNNERLYGKGYSISCRTESGKTFELPIMAHVKDQKDAYLGIKGTMLPNGKGPAAVLGFVKAGVEGFGEAVSKSQTTTTVAQGGEFGGAASAENVTGSSSKYITGKVATATANNRFLNWYLDYYSSLSPTIAVPVGTQIYLSVEGQIQIPKEFFKNSKTRVNTETEFIKTKIDKLDGEEK